MSLLEGEVDYDLSLKVCLLGDMSVGKTCVIKRYIDDTFSSVASTVAVDFVSKIVNVDGKNIKLTIYDTAGQERFRTIHKSYYRQSDLIVFVYDCTELDSLLHIESWMKEVEKVLDLSTIYCVLLGNKIDLPSAVVDEKQLNEIFLKLNSKCQCFKATCSARTGVSVVSVVEKAIREQMKFVQQSMVQPIQEEQVIIEAKDAFENVDLNAAEEKKSKSFFRCFV